MPTTYAHQKFASLVEEQLLEPPKQIIRQYPELYELGLNGPDLFFFYVPYIYMNKVTRIGYGMHKEEFLPFLKSAAEVVRKDGFPAPELSYLYGFLTHFALDRACHPYVYATDALGEISHNEIESELDRDLMEQDGIDPLSAILTDKLVASAETAEILSRFFPISTHQGKVTISCCKRYRNMIVTTSKAKRSFLYGLMHACFVYDWMHGVIINLEPNPKCVETNRVLEQQMLDAVPEAVSFIETFCDCANGTDEWSPLYHYDFCGKKWS